MAYRLLMLLAWMSISSRLNAQIPGFQQVVTSRDHSWVESDKPIQPYTQKVIPDLIIRSDSTRQIIEGFGSCFNELGWTSLQMLDPKDREDVLNELFSPGVGANFTICRMPVGANDFSLNWYSYDEQDGDLLLKNFSIANDQKTLIPFIKRALSYNPALQIWASPWSPPSWMKYNHHYASRSSVKLMEYFKSIAPAPGQQDNPMADQLKLMMDPRYQNDLAADREGSEGTDMFRMEDNYLHAYALYFSKFIEAYKQQGIRISTIMPQNEFNSAQVFPSCCWTAKGLARFIGSYLGPELEPLGVGLMFGTMERSNSLLVDTILQDPEAGKYIQGVGFQWAGKDALPAIYKQYPRLKLYQSEQECGDGKNDWKGAIHSWDLMKHYLNNGVNVYEYWNTSLVQGGISRWGWSQNSLVVINPADQSFHYSYEYYFLKHLSHFVKPGALKLVTSGTYSDILSFINPDKSLVLVLMNRELVKKQIHVQIDQLFFDLELEPESIQTLIKR